MGIARDGPFLYCRTKNNENLDIKADKKAESMWKDVARFSDWDWVVFFMLGVEENGEYRESAKNIPQLC